MASEIHYMQARIFRMYCERNALDAREANQVFNESGAWDFIEECYDSLHLEGDELVYEDVLAVVGNREAAQ